MLHGTISLYYYYYHYYYVVVVVVVVFDVSRLHLIMHITLFEPHYFEVLYK